MASSVLACSFPVLLALLGFLLLISGRAQAMSTVAGTVYCDQCLEGHRTMWGLPLHGATVLVECKNNNGQISLSKQSSTNSLGAYTINLDGSPNMQGCSARLLSSPRSSCNVAENAVQPVALSWKLFGLSMYSADGLSYKPSKPMSMCPKSSKGVVISLPPLPFAKLSACNHEAWLNPQYKCYWRVWSPTTKVSLWYGPAAAKKFGADLTLEQGLKGSGELHRVLLREAITATLNAFNSIKFYYNAVEVDYHFNQALAGTDKDVLKWALNFRRANSGYNGKAQCLLTPCK